MRGNTLTTDLKRLAKKRLRDAEHLRVAGEPERAIAVLMHAFDTFEDHGEKTEADYYRPRGKHQLALCLADLGRDVEAAEAFEQSYESFNDSNFIGRGRVLRDWAWWLYTVKLEYGAAIRKLQLAEALLERDRTDRKRRRRELAIIRALLAYTQRAKDSSAAIAALEKADRILQGGSKWAAERDNLQLLVELTGETKYFIRLVALRRKITLVQDWNVFWTDMGKLRPDLAIGRLSYRNWSRLIRRR